MSVKTIIAESKKGKGQVTQFLEKENEEAEQEYANTKLKRLIAEEKARINELGVEGKKPEAHVSSDLLGHIMDLAQVSPVKAKEFLDSLSEDAMGKLAMISSMGQNGGMNSVLPMLKGGSNIQDIVAIVKLLQDNRQPKESGTDWKGAAELFKAGVEAAKAQQPANPQSDLQYKLVEKTLDELKETRLEMSRQDRSRTDKEIAELKNRPSALQELSQDSEKYQVYKKMFGGNDSTTTNEFTLKREEMQQTERLEDKKLGFEEKKWEYEKTNEGKTIEQITGLVKTVTEGPIGEAIKAIGGAQADKMRGSATKSNSARVVQVKCPSCSGVFPANEQLAAITCPLCGTGLSRGSQPAPQEPQPQAAQSPEKTQESQTQTEQPPAEEQSIAEQPANQQ